MKTAHILILYIKIIYVSLYICICALILHYEVFNIVRLQGETLSQKIEVMHNKKMKEMKELELTIGGNCGWRRKELRKGKG
jgi:bacterioferritin-associated ferredoxin